MPSLVVTGQQIKEKQRGHNVPPLAYMVPKYPSLNRVKLLNLANLVSMVCSCHPDSGALKFL